MSETETKIDSILSYARSGAEQAIVIAGDIGDNGYWIGKVHAYNDIIEKIEHL